MYRLMTFSIVLFLLLQHGATAQHTYSSFYAGDSFINRIEAENRTEETVIVMIPGRNLSTYIYVTTPDGRRGWGDLFADAGYDVYMVNDPNFDFATGGFVEPFKVPEDGKEATPGSEQGWQRDIWSRWGFGSMQGDPYPDALFPTDDFDVFAENYPYIGESDQNCFDAIQAVLDSIPGDVWLMAHSAGASSAVTAARQNAEQVKGLILIEPAGPPDADDFPELNGLHMLGVYGDYIVSRNQTGRKEATEEAATLFQNAGGIAKVVSMPDDSLVNGNSHIMMQDKNSADVFGVIEHWLQQFSANTSVAEEDMTNGVDLTIYPNPATDAAWLNTSQFDGCTYTIYGLNGNVLRSSTLSSQKIDLQGMPNGLLLISIFNDDRTITMPLIKSDS